MPVTHEENPVSVSGNNRTKQIGETLEWVERAVWTDRMLQTLVKGVKGGVWFSLIDKVYSRQNLEASYRKVRSNGGRSGVDHISVEAFGKRLAEEIEQLHTELREGKYKPQRILRVNIPKPGTSKQRPLGIPRIRDRVVQTALRNVLEPIFEIGFHDQSHGFRPGHNCKDALREVDRLLKDGYLWVVDVDLESYFDTIPHKPLLNMIEEKVADSRILELVRTTLKQEVLSDLGSWTPEMGSPQGAVISPLYSNIYLNPLDYHMSESGYRMVRYADDAVVLCQSKEDAQHALAELQVWTQEKHLKLHPEKTCIVDMISSKGLDFLGYHFESSRHHVGKINRWPRNKSMNKLRENIRKHTKRTNGKSMPEIIKRTNHILRGWFNYYQHSHRYTFSGVDGWVRMRLRSILRKRMKKRGVGKGSDHQRWPNNYFRDLGLFSTVDARASLMQSSMR